MRLRQRDFGGFGGLLLHLSFLLILAGALLTWITGEKGSVRIEAGETATEYVREDGKRIPLPCPITLQRFDVIYYPGGEVPRDYVSHIAANGNSHTVSMNKVLDISGYRLCQASYDSSGATVLSVSHDPFGKPLVYIGFVMFFIGGGWLLINPRGRFRALVRIFTVWACLQIPISGHAEVTKIPGVPRNAADSLRNEQVVYGGRIVTFNTLARDIVTKLYGKPQYRSMSAEQTLLSYKLFPDSWKDQPIIKINDEDLRQALGIAGNYATLADLFDTHGNYRVTPLYETMGREHFRAINELDEKVGIILTLLNGDLIIAVPEGGERLEPWRVTLELTYNSIPFGTIIFIVLFIASALFVASFMTKKHILDTIGVGALWLALAVSLCNFTTQWILARHIPLSNTYETLEFVVLLLTALLITTHRQRVPAAPGTFFCATLALVAHLIEVNPVVTPLMPVLHSPWLSLHVSLVMTSYALLAFTAVVAVVALCNRNEAKRLRNVSTALLLPGVWLLGLGIATGSVWADISWGEYWSWDPKENWALITFIIYVIPLHNTSQCGVLRKFATRPEGNSDKGTLGFHLYMLFAILSLAMTYIGVNYLSSLHSYGAT